MRIRGNQMPSNNTTEEQAFQCLNPAVCHEKFTQMHKDINTLGARVEEMNTKLFENNGASYSTRVTLLEKWVENEIKTRAVLKSGMIVVTTALIIQITLGVWNRVEILRNGSMLQAVSQQVDEDRQAVNDRQAASQGGQK
jgi:hypothetical protein